jgi:recombination protein RecT
MSIADVYAIRDRSEAWKAYTQNKSKTCPWVTDEAEMVKKTCVKQAAKYWPRRDRLDNAVHHVNTEGEEGLTITPETVPNEEREKFLKQIEDAGTKEILGELWKSIAKVCQEVGDKPFYDKAKEAVVKQAAFLDGVAKQAEAAQEAA